MDISVITTTYNRRSLLSETIECLQNSIFLPYQDITWEHIVYDDGSTDHTEELFSSSRWGNVLYIRGDTKRGPSYARNRAIERAQGKYIFLIDSDDIALQRTLYNFITVSRHYPSVRWFTADFIRVDMDLKYMKNQDYYGWRYANVQDMLTAIANGDHFLQSNVFFTKELFLAVGGYDESLAMAEDIDLYIRFLLAGDLPIHCDFISHLHRVHGGNLSSGVSSSDHKDHMIGIMKKYHDKIK